ncbi:MAG: toxin-antitoxin system YwqK family antitoxin [bacterium]|nr:toxin-antitoxin system YwqK family antitoxin [bacterium]
METNRRLYTPTLASLSVAAALILFSSNAAASQPQAPKGVPAAAKYHTRGKVWVLEKDSRQVVWYQNGLKKAEGAYSGGQRQGQWRFWFGNGKIKGEGAFKSNLREGPWKLYRKNGVLRSAGDYVKNRREGHWKFYMTDGKTVESEGPYVGGMKNGEWNSYYDNGQVFYKGQYKNDLADGGWTYFYKNGKPYQKGNFRKDVRVGEWTICIQPGGPCGKEFMRSGQTPRTTRIDLDTLNGNSKRRFSGQDTSDPKALLESLDTGGVPDRVPDSIPNSSWQD